MSSVIPLLVTPWGRNTLHHEVLSANYYLLIFAAWSIFTSCYPREYPYIILNSVLLAMCACQELLQFILFSQNFAWTCLSYQYFSGQSSLIGCRLPEFPGCHWKRYCWCNSDCSEMHKENRYSLFILLKVWFSYFF